MESDAARRRRRHHVHHPSHYRRETPEAISGRQDNTMTLDQRERSEPVVVFEERETGLSFKIKMV